MISYSAASDSRTRSSSCSTPVAMACTGVVAIRSRPQEGQNFDFPVISLPQREQNMGASYVSARGEFKRDVRGVSREGVAIRRGGGEAGKRGRKARRKSLTASTFRGKICRAYPASPLPRLAWHVPCSDSEPTIPCHPLGEPVVPYHTIAFSQQKLRAALRRADGQDPAFTYGFVVHSRRQHERPDPGPHHPARREPGVQRAAAEVARRASPLAVRPRPHHPGAGHLDRARPRAAAPSRPTGRWPRC